MKDARKEERLIFLRNHNMPKWLLELKKLNREKEGEMYQKKLAGGRGFKEWLTYAQELD